MNRNRLIEALFKILLWMTAIIINIMYMTGAFEALPDRSEALIITADVSIVVILLWFMPSSMAERKVKKGIKYLDRDNDKAVRYLEGYLDSKMLTFDERKNALRILGVAHHKRGDDEAAINCLNQALEGNYQDNDLKVEYWENGVLFRGGEYQKAEMLKDFKYICMSKAILQRNNCKVIKNFL